MEWEGFEDYDDEVENGVGIDVGNEIGVVDGKDGFDNEVGNDDDNWLRVWNNWAGIVGMS